MRVNKDELVKVRNLCSWSIYFKLQNTRGDIEILPSPGSKNMFVSEIISQVDNGNVFFIGEDDKGSHAKIYIEHDELRKELGFDSLDGKEMQKILTDEKCESILALKTQKSFEKNVKEFVVANHEKDKIIKVARKMKIDSYEKISFLEDYCNMKFKE